MDCDIKQKVCLKKNKAQLTELALECGLTEDEIDGMTISQLCKLIIQTRGDEWEEYGCDVSSNDCNKNMSRKEIDTLAKKCGIEDPKDYENKQLLCDAITKANKKRKKSEKSESSDDDEEPVKKPMKKTPKKDDDFDPKTITYSTFPPLTEKSLTLPKLKSIIDAQKFKISKSQNRPELHSAIKKALKKKETEMGEETEDEKPKKKKMQTKKDDDDDDDVEDEKPKKKEAERKREKEAEEAAEAQRLEKKAQRKREKEEQEEAERLEKKKAQRKREEQEAAEAETERLEKKAKKKREKEAEAEAEDERKKLEREAKAAEDEKPKSPKKKTPLTPPKKTASVAPSKTSMSVEDILKKSLRSLGLYSQIFEKYKIKNDDGKYVIEFKQIRQALKDKLGNKLPVGTMLTKYKQLIQDELELMEEEEEEGVAEVINMDDEQERKEDEAERKRQEAEAQEEIKRQEKEAEVERKRQEKEAEVERKRQEKEAEAERKRQEKEAEEERKRAEAERKRAEAERKKQAEEERMRQEKQAEEARKTEGKMDEKQRIKVMLQKIGLEKFYDTFIDEGYDRISILMKMTEEELKEYIGLNDDEIYTFMTEIAKIKKQNKGRLDKFKTYKQQLESQGMWPPKDWTEEEILEELQKNPGEECDPENNIYCPDDKVCNLSEDPPKCISPKFVNKLKEFKKLDEMEFKGKRIIGSENTIRILKEKLNIKEEGTPIVEPASKKTFKENEEIIEEEEEKDAEENDVPLPFENIEAKNIPEILKELEQTKEEDINNIKLAEAQSTIIKCLGLAS